MMIGSQAHSPLLFVHIPKTAGTSISKTMSAAGVPIRLPIHPKNKKRHISKLVKHAPAEQYRRYYGKAYDDAATFAVVRNPFEWLWSFYRFLKWTDVSPDTGKPWRHEIYKRVASLDFSDFVEFVCVHDGFSHMGDARNLKLLGIHRFTQSAFVSDPDGRVIVRTVFRYERLEQDFLPWLAAHGVHIESLTRTNVSRRLEESADEVYSDRMRDLVQDWFAADFDLWKTHKVVQC